MYVVAIYHIGEGKELLAKTLSSVIGRTELEARARLNAPGNGPFIVAVFGEEAGANDLAGKLRSGGFHVAVLGGNDITREAAGWNVRRFSFGEKELIVESAKGESRPVAYAGIELILRGTGITSSTSTETTKTRSFSLGRAILSSGLSVTKTTKSVREVTSQEREGFFILYAGDEPPLSFRESRVLYDSLGPSRKPSRSANFALLLAELRSRSPEARYDERLLSRPGQAALLGPLLDPEAHLFVATALLAKVLREK